MADFWNRYGIKNTEDEEKDREKNNLSFWARYGQQAEETPAQTTMNEPEPDSFLGKLAQRGVTIELPEPEKKTEDKTAGGLSLLGGSDQAKKAATDLFTQKLGQTFTAQQTDNTNRKIAAEDITDADRKEYKESLSKYRTQEEIQKDLDAANQELSDARKKWWRDEFLAWGGGIEGRTKTLEENDARNAEIKSRIAGLEAEQRQLENAEKYEAIRYQPDFTEKAKAQELTTKDALMDPLYAYINGDKTAGMLLMDPNDTVHGKDNLVAEQMTPDEVKIYNYIHATEGKDAADAYVEFLRPELNERNMESVKDQVANLTDQNLGTKILGSAASVAMAPLRGLAYAGQAQDYLTTGKVDPNAPYNMYSAIPNTMRQTVSDNIEKKWGKWGSFAYQTGMSMADFLLNAGISGGTESLSLAIMGSGAAADATISAKERGLSDAQSFIIGSIAGAAEIASEKISFEKLFKNADLREAPVKYILQNFFFEGSEEVESDVINWLADAIVARDKSEWTADMDAYKAEHPKATDTEAFWDAVKQRAIEGGMDFLGGAISGGVMAGGAVTFTNAATGAQRRTDRSQNIEAVRAARNAQESAQAKGTPGGAITLPTAADEMGAADASRGASEIRMGAEPAPGLKTADEVELENKVAKAKNITEATGIKYGADKADIRAAEKYSRMTGMDVEFYSEGSKNGTAQNGYYDPSTNKIYYNVNAKEKFRFTFGHEFTHGLEGTRAYNALSDLVKTRIDEAGEDLDMMRAQIQDRYDRADIKLTAEQVDQEIVADWIGNNLSDERTIREICRENASVGKQIRDALDSFITRAADMQGIVTKYEEEKYKNVVKAYDRYLERAEEAEAMQPAEQAQLSEPVQPVKTAQERNREWLGTMAEKWKGIKKGDIGRVSGDLYRMAKETFERNPDGTYNITSGKAEQVFDRAMQMARELVEDANTKEDNELFQQYAEPRKYLRETPIHYDRATLVAERGGEEDFKEWRAKQRGILNLTSKEGEGLPIDTIFDEFAEKYPGLLDLTAVQDTDRLDELARVAQYMREQERSNYVNPYEQDLQTAWEELGTEIYQEMANRLYQSSKPKQAKPKQQPARAKTTAKAAAAAEVETVPTGPETAEDYLARMGRLYDAGEITEEQYQDAQAIAAEMESTGRGFESSTVERDEGPRGKIGELIDNLPMKRRFSLSESTERVGELVAVHNLTPEQLYSSWEMGGFAAPSIAVVKSKQGHSKYGPVSVVFGADAIDPKKDYRNNIFGADAYTPTYSNAAVAWEMKADQADALEDKLHDLSLNTANGAFTASSSIIRRYYDSVIDVSPEDFAQRLAKLTEIKSAYLADKGVNVDRVMREIEPKYNNKFTNTTIKNFADSFGADFIDGVYDNETDETTLTDEQYKDITDWFIQDKASKPPMNKNPETAFQRAQRWADDNLYPVLIDNVVRSAWNMTHGTQEPETIVDTDAIENNINKLASTEEVYDWLLPQIKEIYGKRGVRNAKDQFTRSGNRRKFKDLYDDFNIANIVDAMFRNGERGLGANPGSAEGLQSKTARSYSNLDEVRNDSGRLQTVNEEEYKAITDALDERIEEIRHKIAKQNKGDTFIVNIDVGNAILDAASPYATKTRIQSEFKKNGLKIDDNTAGELLQLYKDTANTPTMYFEAKPARNVQLNEIAAVIVPDDMQQYIKDAYTGSNVPVVEYKAGDENDRLEKLNSLENVRFSITEADERAYMDAVEAGDTETAQRMVDEAARAAGYLIRAFHGTPNGTFTVFRNWQYFTEDRSYADVYQKQGASSNGYKRTALNPKTYAVFIDPQNAFDTRNARDREIFENEFFGRYGNGSPLSERGLPDWTDGDDLIEFFEDNGYDYDAIYIDEGGTGGYEQEVNDRGISIVVKDSAQIKSADPVTYDDDGNVIPLTERFQPEQVDIRYSISKDEDGKPFVKVDDTRIDTSDVNQIPKILRDIVKSKDFRNMMVNGQQIGISTNRGVREWVRGKNSRELLRLNPQAYDDKQQSFQNADELLQASRDYINEAPNHEGVYDSFARGTVRFKVGDNGYEADILVGIRPDQSAELYNIVNVVPTKITESRDTGSSAEAARNRQENSVNDIVSQPDEEVKGGFEFSLSDNEPLTLNNLTQKAQNYALRAENALAASVAKALGRESNRMKQEYKDFRAEVIRPAVEAMLRGEDVYVDQFLADAGLSLTEAAAVRSDVEEALKRARGEIGRVRRSVNERAAEQEARAQRNAEIDAQIPDDAEGRIKMANAFKDAKKRWTNAKARTLMTDEDIETAHQLALGQISEEEAYARSPYGYQDVIGMAEAERDYLRTQAPWERYTKRLAERRYEMADRDLENADRAKDKASGFQYARETPERNFRDVFGSDAGRLIDDYIRPIHKSEAISTRFKNDYIKRVKDLGLSQKVARGNQNSEATAVQFLGEAEDNVRYLEAMRRPDAVRDGQTLDEWRSAIEQFKAANPNLNYTKINEAISEFGKIYGELIEQMNAVLVDNGYMPVNIRRGYFPHFNGGSDGILSTFAHLLGINIESNALPTAINGLTSGFKPGKAWFGHAQERTGFRTDYDAIQGFDGYIGGVSDVIHQTKNIRNLRALSTRIRWMMGDEQIRNRINEIEANDTLTETEKEVQIQDLKDRGQYKLSRFVAWLDEYTNLLANKKSKYDRGVEDLMGRRFYTWMKNIEGRVAANMISGNLGSALTNFIPLNQAGAMLGDYSMLRGAFDTMTGRARDDGFVNRSDFLTNRRGTDPLIQSKADKISEFLSSPMNLIDNFTSEVIVRAAYDKYVHQGMDPQSAMQAADEFAAGVMADRSKGATPTIFSSHNPLTKLLTQFQVEVNNEFSTIFKDIPKGVHIPDKEKKNMAAVAAWTMLRYFIGAYLFNDLYEKIVGRRAALDPIDILNDAVGDLTGAKLNNTFDMLTEGVIEREQPKNPSAALKNLRENITEELPFIGGLAGGGRIPISSALPDFEQIEKAASDANWSPEKKRQVIGRELGKTVGTYILPPFAGGLGKKIYQTAENTIKGGRFIKNAEGEDQMQYPYFTDTPLETAGTIAQSALFGPTATEGGRDWVEGGFKTWDAKKTKAYKMLIDDFEKDQHTSYDMISVFYKILPEYDEDGNGSYKQEEVVNALDAMTIPLSASEGATQGLFGGSTEERYLTNDEKAILWQMYNKKWKAANNPYNPQISEQVQERLNGNAE